MCALITVFKYHTASVVTDIKTIMASPQVNDSIEQRASSVRHINMGERSYDMNFKLRVQTSEAKQTIFRLLNSLVFLNVMYLSLIHI